MCCTTVSLLHSRDQYCDSFPAGYWAQRALTAFPRSAWEREANAKPLAQRL